MGWGKSKLTEMELKLIGYFLLFWKYFLREVVVDILK